MRILSWLKTNAPQTAVIVVANRLHTSGQLEISRKDFEGSIERKIDFAVTFDQKLAAQAAKLGKPFAEAGKNAKTVAPLVELADGVALVCSGEGAGPTGKAADQGRFADGQVRRHQVADGEEAEEVTGPLPRSRGGAARPVRECARWT